MGIITSHELDSQTLCKMDFPKHLYLDQSKLINGCHLDFQIASNLLHILTSVQMCPDCYRFFKQTTFDADVRSRRL